MSPTPWLSSISRQQWTALVAAQLGWMLDAMDVMLYAFALTTIQQEFNLSSGQAGALASVTLIASSFGGILFGVLADRIGRAKSLMFSILAYSIFTALTAAAGSVAELVLWRSLVGLGMGGEWSAGSVLVSETWPAEHRGKAIGLMQAGWAIGYILAAVLAAAIMPRFGWRVLFLLGILPAFFTLWIRRHVQEPEIWKERQQAGAVDQSKLTSEIFRPPLLRKTLLGSIITMSVLFAYWGLFTWMPSFLARPIEQGGAGLGIVKSSAWIIPMQIGAFFGYASFGFFADRYGRRPVFVFFLACAALLAPVYGQLARHELVLLILGPCLGFFGHGYFSVFGAMLSELFPTRVRATAQGLVYNVGRAFSALAPYTIGALADRYGIGSALAVTSAFFLAGAALIFLLPETRAKRLE
jgi:putative sialic acid transporter